MICTAATSDTLKLSLETRASRTYEPTNVRSRARAACGLLWGVIAAGCAGTSASSTLPSDQTSGPLAVFESTRPTCETHADVSVTEEQRRAAEAIAERVRAVGNLTPDADANALNQQLDQNYTDLAALGAIGRQVLRDVVRAELARPEKNDFLLLDLGHFLMTNECADLEVARAALEALDPMDPMVRMGGTDLFHFAHAMAFRYGEALLPTVDRIALAINDELFVPQHVLRIPPYMQAAMLWGVTSPNVDVHLGALARTRPEHADLVLRALSVLGSPDVVPEVTGIVRGSPTESVLLRALIVLINGGGDAGREVILGLDVAAFTGAHADKVRQAQDAVRDLTYEGFRARFGPPASPDVEATRARFAAAIRDSGRDDTLEPELILDVALSREELIDWMRVMRSASLRRVSDEGLSDATISAQIMSVLAYRDR